jgi:5-hydroxyisourate hydrolase-like protein (transthyretin family)
MKRISESIIFVLLMTSATSSGLHVLATYDDPVAEHWALIIAGGAYANHLYNVPFWQEDAEELHRILVQSDWWQEDHIKCIAGKNATLTNIIKGLRWLDENEGEEDISLIYIATHGGPLSFDMPPFDEEDGHDECLMTYWSSAYGLTYLWDDELNFFLSMLESKGVCLILDSCFSGGFNDPPYKIDTVSTLDIKTNHKDISSAWAEGFIEDVGDRGRFVLMACEEDELSIVGLFTPRVIDGFKGFADSNGDGIVTAEEMYAYTSVRVMDQHPTVYDGYPGDLPLLCLNTDNETEISTDSYKYDPSPMENIPMVSSENSTICGYILDQSTGEPIEDAYVRVNWRNDEGDDDLLHTSSDTEGYYRLNVSAGEVYFNIFKGNYFHTFAGWINVGDNETVWTNFSLLPYPPEDSTICGYITDALNHKAVGDARVNLRWRSNDQDYNNDTYSNSSGYYRFNVAAGEIHLSAYADRYITSNTDWFTIDDHEMLWVNLSLDRLPPEDTVLCGYITDEKTGKPIEDASIWLTLTDEDEHTNWNFIETDQDGFFTFNVARGTVELQIKADDYFPNETTFSVSDEECLWVNTSLFPYPPERSKICGFLLDAETFEPVKNFSFGMEWYDGKGHYKGISTRSDKHGYYEMSVASGEMYCTDYETGYYPIRISRRDIEDNTTYWCNISIQKDTPHIDIIKPLDALYLNNYMIIPFSKSIVMGRLEIETYVHDFYSQPMDVEKVEFYVDGLLMHTSESTPFIWTWTDHAWGMHAIKVVAYDDQGAVAADQIMVWKLF